MPEAAGVTVTLGVPAGYEFILSQEPPADGLARADAAHPVRTLLREHGTMLAWAASHPYRRELQGRGVAWAVPLPGGPAVVVRHNRHGGLLAKLTGDRFLAPTRAPRELDTALRLAAAGVPTPAVVAYLRYPAGPLLRRADVATAEIAGGADLPAALERWRDARTAMLESVARLIASLSRAGAHHPDLNLKNVLLTLQHSTARAYVLDVDRIRFHSAGAPTEAMIARALDGNLARFTRSARKWRVRQPAQAPTEHELATMREAASAASAAASRGGEAGR